MIKSEPNFRLVDPPKLIQKVNSVILGIYGLVIGDWIEKPLSAISFWGEVHKYYRVSSSIRLQGVEGERSLDDCGKVVGSIQVEAGYRIKEDTESEDLTLRLDRAFFLRSGRRNIPKCKIEVHVDFPESGLNLCPTRQDYIEGRFFGYRPAKLDDLLQDDWFFKDGLLRREQPRIPCLVLE